MIYFIVGKTSSGKDTIAKYLEENHNIKPVVSYTTRPKRSYEINGKQHYFISKEQMKQIKEQKEMMAYTINEKTQIEYCATTDELDKGDVTYIINPDGIKWFREHVNISSDNYKIIGVTLDEEIIKTRALRRGDDPEVFEKRLQSEREEFDDFFKNEKEIDLILDSSEPKRIMFKKLNAALNEMRESDIYKKIDDDFEECL